MQRRDVEQKVAELLLSHPSLEPSGLRVRTWAVECSVFPFAAQNSHVDPAAADRFFTGFWRRIAAELRADFNGDQDAQARFDHAVESLVIAYTDDHSRLSPEAAVMATGKRIAELLEVPDGTRLASVWSVFAIEYGHKMVAAAKLLQQLPE
jgi:hypothetical protein